MKEKWESFMETLGETETMSRKEFLLVLAVCILGGIVFGMLVSPRKFTTIGCYNGNSGSRDEDAEEEIMEWED